ncbi:MAG: hypothetical protein M3460_25705 [Actinomycetota bacterium]|nr:hypothetical protein [Actinomycetota bacterium]
MIARASTDGQSTSEGRTPGAPVLATVPLIRSALITLAFSVAALLLSPGAVV